MKLRLILTTALIAIFSVATSFGYDFKDDKILPSTNPKNQASSGTCWCFATISMLESELIRTGKGEFDLSEMWVVRNAYLEKAKNYVRLHGKMSLHGGGAGGDAPMIIDKYGIVPEEVYRGLNYGTQAHQHGELDAVVAAYVEAIVKNPNKRITPVWIDGLSAILDTYLGEAPEKFTYKGKEYTPMSFARELGLRGENYVQITSFTHHPYYTSFMLELPDNWSFATAFNVPFDRLVEVVDASLAGGYTISWAADVSESGFKYGDGFAVVPAAKLEDMSTTDKARWGGLSQSEISAMSIDFSSPSPELEITPELRQIAFDNYQTTDDHSMHIVGTAHDVNGKKYYKVKNSWGDGGVYNGYFYVSVAYVKYKTTSIIVNKEALPKDIVKIMER